MAFPNRPLIIIRFIKKFEPIFVCYHPKLGYQFCHSLDHSFINFRTFLFSEHKLPNPKGVIYCLALLFDSDTLEIKKLEKRFGQDEYMQFGIPVYTHNHRASNDTYATPFGHGYGSQHLHRIGKPHHSTSLSEYLRPYLVHSLRT